MQKKMLVPALIGLACLVVGILIGSYFQGRRCSREAKAAAAAHEAELGTARTEAERWAEALATRQGEAVLKSFVSGIAPSILSERRESLELSAVSLLREPGVEGIHVVGPDGSVVYSSDVKLSTMGEGGDKAVWAAAVTDFTSRTSNRPGVIDYAVPVIDSGRVLAVVWLEFGRAKVRDLARPTAGGPAAAK